MAVSTHHSYLTKASTATLCGSQRSGHKGDSSPEESILESLSSELVRKRKGNFSRGRLAIHDRKEMAFSRNLSPHGKPILLFVPQNQRKKHVKEIPYFIWAERLSLVISFDRMKDLKERTPDPEGKDVEGFFTCPPCCFHSGYQFWINSLRLCMELGQRWCMIFGWSLHSSQELPVLFFDKNRWEVSDRLTRCQNVHEMFTSVLINLLKDILLVIGCHSLLHFNRELAWSLFLSFPDHSHHLFFSHQARDAFREIRWGLPNEFLFSRKFSASKWFNSFEGKKWIVNGW